MFKLVKILHSPTNAPEICYLPVDKNHNYKIGEAVRLVGGVLTNCSASDKPTFITVAECKKNSEETIPCIHVCRDMIFEVELFDNAPLLDHGEELSLYTDSDGSTIAVTSDSMIGCAAVYEFFEDHTSAGDKIYVRFL